MSEAKLLSKLKKAELQALAQHLKVPGGTDGLRPEIEARIQDFAKKQGGFEALAASGKLSNTKFLSALGLDDVAASAGDEESDIEVSPSPSPTPAVSSSPRKLTQRSSPKKSTGSVAASQPAAEGTLAHFVKTHGPWGALKFLEHHLTPTDFPNLWPDVRALLATADRLVLILVYIEFFSIVWHQLGWSASPLLTIPVPALPWRAAAQWEVHWPLFAPLLQRKQFLYPVFYWFVYFVVIPTALGWLINFKSAGTNKPVCPINMLTFSYVRLVLFWLMLTTSWFGTGEMEFTHRSVGVLFSGLLSFKLFAITGMTGILYALYES